MMDFIKGKTIVSTGGTTGFVLEAARILRSRGAKVGITVRTAKRLGAAKKELAHANLLAVQADATVTADWQKLFKAVAKRFGNVDVLVNNHGAGIKIAPLEEMTDEEIRITLATNIESVIIGCREAVRLMKASIC